MTEKFGSSTGTKAISLTEEILSENVRIVRRRIVSEYPVRVKYSLTDLGRAFEPVLLAAACFSMKHMPKIVFKDDKPREPSKLLIIIVHERSPNMTTRIES